VAQRVERCAVEDNGMAVFGAARRPYNRRARLAPHTQQTFNGLGCNKRHVHQGDQHRFERHA
jgi:hypothetical protein